MSTRAVRGWSLGHPEPLWKRRKNKAYDCDCTRSKPYLHSLIMTSTHWPGPIFRDDHPELDEARQVMKRTNRFRSMASILSEKQLREQGSGHFQGRGGFWTYKLPHCHKMAKWDEIDVMGVVTIFGYIVEHEYGYRSEGIRIDRLWVLRLSTRSLRRSTVEKFLSDTYQCPVTMLRPNKVESFTDWIQKEDVEAIL